MTTAMLFDINEGMKAITIEEQLRRFANRSGMSILAMSKASNIGYMSLHSFLRGGRTMRMDSASRLATILNLELRPRQAKGD